VSRSTHRRYRSHRAVLPVLLAAALIGCGGPREADVTGPPNARATESQQAAGKVVVDLTSDEISAFRNALWATPEASQAMYVPLSIADHEQTSAALVNGTIRAATVGPDHVVSEFPVQCEASEGVPIEGECVSRLSVKMVTFTIQVDNARTLAKNDGTPVNSGQEVTLELLVGATDNGSPAAADAAQAIVDSTPIGSSVAAFAFRNPAKTLQLSSPDSWALVDQAGGFVSLSQGAGSQGFLGLQQLSELAF